MGDIQDLRFQQSTCHASSSCCDMQVHLFLMDCACCVFVAKAAKYGALQGFLGGAGGVYRGKSVIYLLLIPDHKIKKKQTEKK